VCVCVTTKPLESYTAISYDIFRVTLVCIKHDKDGRPIQTVDTGIVQVSVRLCRIDWWRPNVVTFADSGSPDEHTRQEHPAVMTPFISYRVLVTEASITCKVRAATVDNVVGRAADAPVKVLSKDRLNDSFVSCTVEQLSFNQRRRPRPIISRLNLLPLANIHTKTSNITIYQTKTQFSNVKNCPK